MVALGTLIHQAKIMRCGDGDYPVLSMTMHDGLVFQDEKFKKVIASKDRTNYKIVKRNQLVISFPIDEGVLAVQRIVDAGIVSPAYSVWEIDQSKIFPEFLEYALRCDRALSYYKAKLRGSTARRRSLPTPTLLEYTVPLPDISEQEHILGVIHKVKSVISSYAEEITLLDNLIKARFVEMFGDPVQNPFQWDTRLLLDMGYCKNGMNFHTGDSGIEMHCLGVGAFKDYATIDGTDHLPTISLNEVPPEESMLQDGDIVFVRSNGNKALVGRCVVVYPRNTPTTYSGFCIRYRLTSNEVNTSYLLRALKTDSMRKKMAGRGANIQNLNQQILATLNIPLPPMVLQEQFATFVEQVDKSKVVDAIYKINTLFDIILNGGNRYDIGTNEFTTDESAGNRSVL